MYLNINRLGQKQQTHASFQDQRKPCIYAHHHNPLSIKTEQDQYEQV